MENTLKQATQATVEIIFNTLQAQCERRRIERLDQARKELEAIRARVEKLKKKIGA